MASALLACERFTGHQTSDAIASKLKNILNRYEILKKCVAITTDNASNFKCCLQKHSDDYEELRTLMNDPLDEQSEMLFHLDLNDLETVWCADELSTNSSIDVVPLAAPGRNENDDTDSDDDDESNSSGTGFKIRKMPTNIIENVVDDTSEISLLPNRSDCGAHTLNLIGKVDAFDALKADSTYRQAYVSVFTKMNAIWRINSTRLGREMFRKYLGKKTILKPHRIRWNRIFDAVRRFHFIFSIFQLKF